jgi:7,8-dihydro-6-hydroxymethylpterin-pyrophosphokinase
MKKISHGALLHFSTDLVGGPSRIQSLLYSMSESIRPVEISSIYKKFKSDEHVDLNASMEFVAKVITQLSPEMLVELLKALDKKSQVLLLTFDDLILMSPSLTLPYPELHIDPLIIHCAAEAWGQYEHPVYQKTLSEISRGTRVSIDTEFFLQGRTLIDI